MHSSIAVVRNWEVAYDDGGSTAMNAASLAKQVVAHVALEVVDNLDQPIHDDITTRHILTHTTGLPNWRPEGEPLESLRPPGTRWGYSGEGFALLQRHLERLAGVPLPALAETRVFGPMKMHHSHFAEAEPGFHGSRPLMTTAADYGRFLSQVLRLDDERWQPLWRIDDEIAWSAGWGLELGPPLCGWQWGLNDDASSFVIGCPSTGDGVVVLCDDPDGRSHYTEVVAREMPGHHASLHLDRNEAWLNHFI